jgi:hypothetical protein
MSSHFVAARFSDEVALLDAVKAARADGFGIVDAYSPYPVHGLEAAMGLPRSRLPRVAFGAGLAGVVFGLGFQFYIAALDWPLDVGGKPLNSALAFVPITFEIAVLLAGLAVTAAFFLRCRLFPGARPIALDEAATLEGFVLVLRTDAGERARLRLRTAAGGGDGVP